MPSRQTLAAVVVAAEAMALEAVLAVALEAASHHLARALLRVIPTARQTAVIAHCSKVASPSLRAALVTSTTRQTAVTVRCWGITTRQIHTTRLARAITPSARAIKAFR